jgi:hypothetical protein
MLKAIRIGRPNWDSIERLPAWVIWPGQVTLYSILGNCPDSEKLEEVRFCKPKDFHRPESLIFRELGYTDPFFNGLCIRVETFVPSKLYLDIVYPLQKCCSVVTVCGWEAHKG